MDSSHLVTETRPTNAAKYSCLHSEVETELIRVNLDLMEGNRSKTAQVLGMGERTLYRKIKEYDL